MEGTGGPYNAIHVRHGPCLHPGIREMMLHHVQHALQAIFLTKIPKRTCKRHQNTVETCKTMQKNT